MTRAALRCASAWALLVAFGSLGCAPEKLDAEPPPTALTSAHAQAELAGVPPELVYAIAVVEGGLALPQRRVLDLHSHVPAAGIMQLRRGAFNSLARGAELLERSEEELRRDTGLGTEAGILVLAELGGETGARSDDLASWRAAVGKLSGYRDAAQMDDYAARVFAVLTYGGRFPLRDGAWLTLEAHRELAQLQFLAPPAPPPMVEFPGAIWADTSCTGKCNTTREQPIDAILIHDTEGGWDASMATLQFDPGKSVHYLIDRDGSRVAQFIPEAYNGWHAGNSCWNNRSIGIEHVGFAGDPYAAELYEKSAELVKSILQRYPAIPLDREHIVGHYQVPAGSSCVPACAAHLAECEESPDFGGSGNHRDPGYTFQWCQYMERLGGSCTCNDAWSNWNCTTDGKQMWRCTDGEVEKQECVGGCNVMPVGTPDACVAIEPEGGAGAGGSASGSAGAAGVAGAASGGSAGSAVQHETGGASWTGGVNASGGGTAGTSVAVAPGPGVAIHSAQTDSGCSCVVVGYTRRATSSTGAAAMLLLGFGLRRRFRTAASRRS
jgi:hypothetical protein